MRVSVIMPVRDGLAWLDEAVRSVLDQDAIELELVAVDDGSTDGSLERLEHWARTDGRVRVLSAPTPGIVGALNHGVNEARADLVARADVDDVSLPGRLAAQLERMATDPAIDVLGTGASVISDRPTPGLDAYHEWVSSLCDHDSVELGCLIESPLVHSSVMIRRDLLLEYPYRKQVDAVFADGLPAHDATTWPEDYDLWLRLLRAGKRFANLPHRLVSVRNHPDRTTISSGFTIHSMARLALAHLLETRLRDKPDVVVQGAGRHGKMWARMLTGAGVRVKALLDVAEKRLGKRIDGIEVRPVSDLVSIRRELVLVAVGQKGPNTRRDEVRKQLSAMGLTEGSDFVFVC